MKKMGAVFLVAIFWPLISLAGETSGYHEITRIDLYHDQYIHFWLLDENCPAPKNYFTLRDTRVPVDRYFSAISAAYYAGKKVKVEYATITGNFCEVTRIYITQ